MAKELVIPPIKGNPKWGQLTENDAAVQWGGAKVSNPGKVETVIAKEKKPREKASASKSKKGGADKKSNQKNFLIHHLEDLKALSKEIGMSQAAVLNLGLAKVRQEFKELLK